MLHLLVLNSTHAAISLSPSIFSYDDLDALRSMDHEEFQECVNATNMKAGHGHLASGSGSQRRIYFAGGFDKLFGIAVLS